MFWKLCNGIKLSKGWIWTSYKVLQVARSFFIFILLSWTFFKPQSCNHTFGGKQEIINSIFIQKLWEMFFFFYVWNFLDWITMQVFPLFFMMTCHLNYMSSVVNWQRDDTLLSIVELKGFSSQFFLSSVVHEKHAKL